jgi:hypothetical protein
MRHVRYLEYHDSKQASEARSLEFPGSVLSFRLHLLMSIVTSAPLLLSICEHADQVWIRSRNNAWKQVVIKTPERLVLHSSCTSVF